MWGGFWIFAVQFCSCSHTPALAILCPLEEWCENSARAMATVVRSCRNMERSRRSLRRCAAPETGCSLRSILSQVTHKRKVGTLESDACGGGGGSITRQCACTELGGRSPGSQTPGDPAPLPRTNRGGQPWPCACAQGPTTHFEHQQLLLHTDRHVNNGIQATTSSN